MSSLTTPKSERSQTLTAVIFMSLFVTVFVIIILAREGSWRFVCQYEGLEGLCTDPSSVSIPGVSDPLIASEVISACVDADGLRLSVAFGSPLAGEADIQVFTTGEDVFPSERGMSDTFITTTAIPAETDHLDIEIPVESMSVDEHVFGNITVRTENVVSSHVSYFVIVSGCSAVSSPATTAANDNHPTTYRMTCLANERLMIAFEFDQPVFGQYQTLVGNQPFALASVGNQPAILFFSGDFLADGPTTIKLISATSQIVLLEETVSLPDCSAH